jgi:hypothetical protein
MADDETGVTGLLTEQRKQLDSLPHALLEPETLDAPGGLRRRRRDDAQLMWKPSRPRTSHEDHRDLRDPHLARRVPIVAKSDRT